MKDIATKPLDQMLHFPSSTVVFDQCGYWETERLEVGKGSKEDGNEQGMFLFKATEDILSVS